MNKINCEFTEKDLTVLRAILISDTDRKRERLEAAQKRGVFKSEVLAEISTEIDQASALIEKIDFYLTTKN